MIRISDKLWVGDAHDADHADVGAILNVARDLLGKRGWPTVEYAQVGLVDGPGNSISAYCAATLALVDLMRRCQRVLVHCHEGRSRSLAVAVMYLNTTADRGWDRWLELLRERVDADLPDPHEAHKVAFDKINWRLLDEVIR